jgi:DNA-binding transcriptional LysR family regulator
MRKTDVTVPTHSRLTINTAEAAITAAIAGIGITRVLSYQVAEAIKAGALVAALQEFEPAPWPVSIVFAGQRLLPLKLRAFLDFATPRLRARLPRISDDEFAGRRAAQKTRRKRGRR